MSDQLALPNQLRRLMRSLQVLHCAKALRDGNPSHREYWNYMVRQSGAVVRERYQMIIDMQRTGHLS